MRLDGLTVSEVATRAAVHQTSIYRRWGTRENLILDTLLTHAERRLPVPDTGSLHGDLLAYATVRRLAPGTGTPATSTPAR